MMALSKSLGAKEIRDTMTDDDREAVRDALESMQTIVVECLKHLKKA
jgi:hypothetical protein